MHENVWGPTFSLAWGAAWISWSSREAFNDSGAGEFWLEANLGTWQAISLEWQPLHYLRWIWFRRENWRLGWTLTVTSIHNACDWKRTNINDISHYLRLSEIAGINSVQFQPMAAGWLLPGVTLAMGLPAGLVAMAEEGRDGIEVCWLFCLE